MDFYAPASPGTERALRDELSDLGFSGVRLNRGGIPFQGDLVAGMRACLQSRIAQRIQALLTTFEARSADELYAGVREVDWSEHVGPEQSVSVSAFTRSRVFGHSGYTALKVKDALVDQVRDRYGARPNVDREDPDIRVFVYVAETRVKVYLDLSGEALYRRGYRASAGEAPVRETLAAAVLRLSGWDRRSGLADPMCGSGTLAIEAALWAGNVAPGIFRDRFGFERWASHGETEKEAIRRLRGEARAAAHRQHPGILASDCDPEVLTIAQANAKAAGVRIRFRCGRVQDFQCGDQVGTVVSNPPYDLRLATTTAELREIGAAFSRMHGKRLCLLSGNPELRACISAGVVDRVPVKNGSLDCEVLVYEVP